MYCCNRPYMNISYVEKGDKVFLGKIKIPFTLCSITYEIEDAKGNLKYTISGSGFEVGMPTCCFCSNYKFEVKNKSGELVTVLNKIDACENNCSKKLTPLSFGFPQIATTEEKALLLAAALFLECNYFVKLGIPIFRN